MLSRSDTTARWRWSKRTRLHADPVLLERLQRIAAARGETWTVTRRAGSARSLSSGGSGDNRASNPFPVARRGHRTPASGDAADVTIGGRPIQAVVSRGELLAGGVVPLAGDAVHVDLPS